MGHRERKQAAFKPLIASACITFEGATSKGLHSREGVFDPVIELLEEHPLMLVTLLEDLGRFSHDAGDFVRFSESG